MNEFPQRGRLLQSTRGFGLEGLPYVFETPIKPRGKKSAFKKKRAKGGKIIYDNPRERLARHRRLYGENRKLRRSAPDIGRNAVGENLNRLDFGGFADSLNKLFERRAEAEEDRIYQLKQLEIAKNRALRREENAPQLVDVVRERREIPQEINRPKAVEGGGVVEEPDSPREVKEEDIPEGISPIIQSFTKEEGEPKKSRLGQGDKRDVIDLRTEEEFIPERERGGESRYSLRSQRADVSYAESEESGGGVYSTESEFDPSEIVESPIPKKKRRSRRGVSVVEVETPSDRQKAVPDAPPNFPEVSREDIEEGLSREAQKRLDELEKVGAFAKSKRLSKKQRAKEFLKRAGGSDPFVGGDKPVEEGRFVENPLAREGLVVGGAKSLEEGTFRVNPLAREGLVFEGRGIVNPLEEEGAVFGGRVNLRDVDSVFGSDVSNEIPYIFGEGET